MPRKPRQKAPGHAIAQRSTPDTTDPESSSESQYIARHTGKQVAPERKATIYSCADHVKMSASEIARRLGMDYRTVAAVLANRDADAIEARNYLAANVLQAAEDWVTASKEGAKKGKHTAAKDLLLHTKVIEPIQAEQQITQIAIVVGRPRDTTLVNPPQVIDVESDSQSES